MKLHPYERFNHRLALACGEWDVDAMLKKMTHRQRRKWMAYFKLEPWGCITEDIRWAQLRADIHNMAGKKLKDGKIINVEDLLPDRDGSIKESKKQTPAQQFETFKLLAKKRGNNGKNH